MYVLIITSPHFLFFNRENESLETEIEKLESSEEEKDKGENDHISAISALLDDMYENVSEVVRLYRSMTSGKEQVL